MTRTDDAGKPMTTGECAVLWCAVLWCPCGCGARQVRHSADCPGAELNALGFGNCEDVQSAWLAHCDRNDGQPAPYELVKATSICAGGRGITQ